MNVLDQIDAIKSEARENFLANRENKIREICQKKRVIKPSKPTFASAMHSLAEKEDNSVFLAQSIDFAVDTHMESDLASENLAEIFG